MTTHEMQSQSKFRISPRGAATLRDLQGSMIVQWPSLCEPKPRDHEEAARMAIAFMVERGLLREQVQS